MSTTALLGPVAHHKIHRAHYDRLAAVYVRQSTPQQMIRHQESTRLQYGLVERALALGWAQPQVLVIDEDLGKSADSMAGRSGFQRLVAEVSLAHVGIILGLEMSRLARSNSSRVTPSSRSCTSSFLIPCTAMPVFSGPVAI